MTQRMQITLQSDQHRRAKRKAAALGISLAEYIRRLVDRDLAGTDTAGDASNNYDMGHGGDSDVGRDRERMLGEALDETTPG